ncbi:NrfD/PsrC family molybdoenzyme membrane anchor subunit [Candidatus Nitrospira salsa]|nr:MAG: molybdopterin oxidoreductase membrane subunit [Nitrospirales bacterium]
MKPEKSNLEASTDINRDLLTPLEQTDWTYYLFIAVLASAVLVGAGAWTYQIQNGIGQTNLHRPIFWGSYIGSFVYWIGVSHSGTFISGVLRLTNAEWRRPVTRMAELMTIISVIIAALFVFVHLGRVWLFYYLIPYPNQREIWPNFRSPLMWDATAIFTYATASSIYLYLPLIPDFALLRERIHGWRKNVYRVLAMGWHGSQRQWQNLETAIKIITPLIVMVMISVHSIVGWDFGVSLVPGWHSTIFAPYFVVGAVHSGLAMVIIGLYVLRKIYRLHEYVRVEHFEKLAKLLVVTTLLLAYLYFAEQLTIWYGNIPDHRSVQQSLLTGTFAFPFWTMMLCVYLVPLCTLTIPQFRRWPLGLMIVGVLINIGMYIERLLIMVPPLVHPRLSFQWSHYFPSVVELTILVGALSLAVLLYCLAIKFVPVISIWEEKIGRIHAAPHSSS